MSKALIIAEKPSVAADIARALGGFTRHTDYFENDDYIVSSAVGHLLEIAAPEQYEVKRGKWSFAHLPVIPPHFDIQPIARNQERLKMLTRLIRRKDVVSLINACDAGREGELIFRLIVQHAKSRLPVRRLWLQSMTAASIRDAFQRLRDDQSMLPLADAARCRSEADWLVGINGTRAMTAFNSREGGFYLTTVGRVQTPTLAIVVDREDRIRQFVSRDYFEVRASFAAAAGTYEGRWFDPGFRKGDDPEARAERLWERAQAQAIVDACAGQPGIVTEDAKPSTQAPPQLFDLTSLQKEGNSRFGFSAKTTLSLAQALYEKHKVLTYPRTDSRALPEDYLATVGQTLTELESIDSFAPFARRIREQGWVRPNRRIFDNSKVSDHFAIIPTLQTPKQLSDAERRIYDLVVRRFLAVFHPSAEFLNTTRLTTVNGYSFKTEGKVLVNPGWLAVYGRTGVDTDSTGKPDASLVPVLPDERVLTESVELQPLATRPPPRLNESTLLSAMEGAGKLVEDGELREAMADKGLGTPATRAAIIEGLISENYLVREGKDLIPTAKAFQLLTLLRGLGVQELTLPELTGEWEHKLAQMERGQLGREAFMTEIAEVTRRIVERAKNYQSDTVPGNYATLRSPCPKCGGTVQENYKRFACTACDFSISKHPGGRSFEIPEVETLLRERTLGPLQGFRSRLGRPFAAILRITSEDKLEFDFGQGADSDREDASPIDFSGQPAFGACPKCGANVHAHGLTYVCERSVGPQRSCDFRSGKIILQQEINGEQMQKLLGQGRTDLLPGFVSTRTRRKFKAYLVRNAEGKIVFEFEPRPERPGKAGTGTRAATAPDTAAAPTPEAPDGNTAEAAPARRTTKAATARGAAAKSGTAKAPAKKTATTKRASAGTAPVARAKGRTTAPNTTDSPPVARRPTARARTRTTVDGEAPPVGDGD